MKKISNVLLNVGIGITIIITLFINFIVCPVFLSLDIFGLQDATIQNELQTRFYSEIVFYFLFGILFILGMVVILIVNRKIYKNIISFEKVKRKILILTIAFFSMMLLYCIGSVIINKINNNRIIGATCIISLLPAVFYLAITAYLFITLLLSSTNNDFKDIKDNTL